MPDFNALYQPAIKDALASYTDHALRLVADNPLVKVYTLRRQNTWAYGSTLIFHQSRMTITGDVSVAGNGVVSVGLSPDALGWFSFFRSDDPHYVAGKFLKKGWHGDLFEYGARNRAQAYAETGDPVYVKEASALRACAKDAPDNPLELQQNFEHYGFTLLDLSDLYELGHGYAVGEVMWLCAINRTFARLYKTLGS